MRVETVFGTTADPLIRQNTANALDNKNCPKANVYR